MTVEVVHGQSGMRVGGRDYRSIWVTPDGWSVGIIDQTQLPHRLVERRLDTLAAAAQAIREMWVRGAPLVGATAAYGLALALRDDPSATSLEHAAAQLRATRPTAVNLGWALDRVAAAVRGVADEARPAAAYACAAAICDEDVALNRRIGEHGLPLIAAVADQLAGERPVHILTHCNAGWLATVDWGTALAPVYLAHQRGLPVHVWVDETRPRNQGASLTAWELGQQGIPHTVIVDNAGGHLMQHGQVDLCLVGTDRTTATGDVANKIGTYLKALAAHDNGVPFYVCAPSPSIDWALADGRAEIPIEQRDAGEVAHVFGALPGGELAMLRVVPEGSAVVNVAFDVTPARLVTGIITERGVAPASRAGLAALFPAEAAAGLARARDGRS